jgi:hypothetical protein
MAKWILLTCFFSGLSVLSGCFYEEVGNPAIIFDYDPRIIDVKKNAAPESPKPARLAESVKIDVPGEWIPPARLERKWTAIVLHHSATETGNAAFFNKAHEGRCDENGVRWKGIGYDFVIGNGTMSGDGQVEVTFRWRQQITGAHCKTNSSNWANRTGIGICLVGHFDNTTPSRHQMDSLVQLVQFLQQRYGIPKSRIYGHGQTPGAGPTACPGKRFPIQWLKSQLDF